MKSPKRGQKGRAVAPHDRCVVLAGVAKVRLVGPSWIDVTEVGSYSQRGGVLPRIRHLVRETDAMRREKRMMEGLWRQRKSLLFLKRAIYALDKRDE